MAVGVAAAPAAGHDGLAAVLGIVGVDLPADALELHRLAGQAGQPRRLLAGEVEGILPHPGEKLVLPPGVDGAGVAEGAGTQHPVDVAAAVLVLEAAPAVGAQGHGGVVVGGGGVLFVAGQEPGAKGLEVRVLHRLVPEVMLLVHRHQPAVAAVVGAGGADAAKGGVKIGLDDVDLFYLSHGGMGSLLLLVLGTAYSTIRPGLCKGHPAGRMAK